MRPASYLFAFALRESMFGPGSVIMPFAMIAFPLALFAVAAVVFNRGRRGFPSVPVASFAGGLAGMALSAGFMLAYQAAAGTIYERLGALSGAYMAGAAAGATAGRMLSGRRLFLPAAGAGFAALGIASFFGLRPACALGASAWSLPAFMVLQAAAGFLTGALFPLIARSRGAGGASGAAVIWSSDLAGAAAGAMIAGAVSIPLLGIPQTALLAGLVAFVGVVPLSLGSTLDS
jgi:spermidine synthase